MQSLNLCGFEVAGEIAQVGVVFINLNPEIKRIVRSTSSTLKENDVTRLPVQGSYYHGELEPSLISGERLKTRCQGNYDVHLAISARQVQVEVVVDNVRLTSKTLSIKGFNAQSFSLVQLD